MLADYFTKAWQGKLFTKMIDIIMGISCYSRGVSWKSEKEDTTGGQTIQNIGPKTDLCSGATWSRRRAARIRSLVMINIQIAHSIWIIQTISSIYCCNYIIAIILRVITLL